MEYKLKYFKPHEFTMGGQQVFDKMDKDFLERLDRVRHYCGFPFKINSSYRSSEYNKKIGGVDKSTHTYGLAVDVHCTDGVRRARLVKVALEFGLSVGVYKTFIHLDFRTRIKKPQVCFRG